MESVSRKSNKDFQTSSFGDEELLSMNNLTQDE